MSLGVILILIGLILVALGFMMLIRRDGEPEHNHKSYAVFLIGPFPIIFKGGKKVAVIAFVVSVLLILLIFISIGGLI